ncbi:hypothetical protein HZA96_07255 [Candidatus Woesearchaeota archaeon]|nr:hypothetical protein [Candidatus Woesearchaeota archaeon]
MIYIAKQKIILTNIEPELNASSDDLAKIIIQRLGLMPRKENSTDKMHQVLIELYERAKIANREKHPTKAVMTVEEMGMYAGITRQTMYEYLKRWLEVDMITKMSYVLPDNSVIIGYKLNGPTLEHAFERARTKVHDHLNKTHSFILELQKIVKNEKISQKMTQNIQAQNIQQVQQQDKSEDRKDDIMQFAGEKNDES